MNDLHTRCLDTFPDWLRTLAADALDLSSLLTAATVPESARRYVAGSLNYLFKSLDLIPDGIEDLGFLDDAFVLRVAAAMALDENPDLRHDAPVLTRLAADSKLVAELLGEHHVRLERYVKGLTKGAARGRTVDEIVADEPARRGFLNEVNAWASSYAAPNFTRDEKNIVKLEAFLTAKLPA